VRTLNDTKRALADGLTVKLPEHLSPRTVHLLIPFERALHEHDLYAALAFLNGTTPYRFTGVYCFEPGLVRSVVLYDRENRNLRMGEDVPWFDSYCMLTAENGVECEIQNSVIDARLSVHAARLKVLSYCAVLLRAPSGEELGTLCHYDVVPKKADPAVLEGLRACRPAVEMSLWEHLDTRRHSLPPE
jgi:hypothetical protein